jgi:hypothetical protein
MELRIRIQIRIRNPDRMLTISKCVEQAVGEDLVCEEVGLTVENMSTVPGHHYNLTTLKLSSQVGLVQNYSYKQILWGTTGIFASCIPLSLFLKSFTMEDLCIICYHLLVFVCV